MRDGGCLPAEENVAVAGRIHGRAGQWRGRVHVDARKILPSGSKPVNAKRIEQERET